MTLEAVNLVAARLDVEGEVDRLVQAFDAHLAD